MRFTRTLLGLAVTTGMVGLVACGGEQQASQGEAGAEAEPGAETAAAGQSERYRAVAVPEGLTWEEARQRAEADGGHLVVITSAEENELVYSLIADNPDLWVSVDVVNKTDGEGTPIQVTLGPWIGLYQRPGSAEPAGGWTWVTGEALDYDNWVRGDEAEPNNMGGVEHYGEFFGPGVDNPASSWNDVANDPVRDFAEAGMVFEGDLHNPRGYIVEFER